MAKTTRTAVVRSMSASSKAPPPRKRRITRPPTTTMPMAAPTVSTAMMPRVRAKTRLKAARSPAAAATDITGKAAMANDAPMRLTGTLWKLRAKLTELTDPASRLEARATK